MGERIIVQCETCRDRGKCSDRDLRYWDTARYMFRGAEIIPCKWFREDVRIELGYAPGPSPHPFWSSRRQESHHGRLA